MSIKKAWVVFGVCLVGFLIEAFLFYGTGMGQALEGSGQTAVIAYKFYWLMALTMMAGVIAPLSVVADKLCGRKNLASFFWVLLISIFMISFTARSFVTRRNLQSVKIAKSMAIKTVKMNKGRAVMLNNDTMEVSLRFKNKSKRKTVVYLHYELLFLDMKDKKTLIRQNILTPLEIGPKKNVETKLQFDRGTIKNTDSFEALKKAVAENSYKIKVNMKSIVLGSRKNGENKAKA